MEMTFNHRGKFRKRNQRSVIQRQRGFNLREQATELEEGLIASLEIGESLLGVVDRQTVYGACTSLALLDF
jgi:ribosomal protein S1